ncbi:MAG TPA: site-2 protease family protein [Planctomycetaceae bacterium]|nr:site-2 protease family protein [Planctomycetaceae bacterium]
MLGQPLPPTEYDLRFSVFGIPVRVHPVFWLTAALLTWEGGHLDLTLIGMLAVFVSILVHELGHAFATRRLGGRSEIVLEFMGGYATTIAHSRLGNIMIAAAGPAAGFALWLVARIILRAPIGGQLRENSLRLYFFVRSLEWMNLVWNLLNLLPVWPLDGAHIAREVIGRFRRYDGWEMTLKLSIVVAVGFAAWAVHRQMTTDDDYRLTIALFAILAFQNFQTLQMSQTGRW